MKNSLLTIIFIASTISLFAEQKGLTPLAATNSVQTGSTYAGDYNSLACLQSLQNQTEAAFGSLEKALKNGFNFYVAIQQDSTFVPLREQKKRW